jgi:ABC-type branched-subunit amino acid transport system ATPase component/branched-subunit amino acid ABC-type transport system permease component
MSDVVKFAILGLGLGAIYAALGQSVVIVHRGSGVLNFASGAVGTLGAYVFYDVRTHGLPTPLAFVVGIACSAALGVLFYGGIMRRLADTSSTTKIVATLGLMTLLVGVISLIFAPEGQSVAVDSFLPSGRVVISSSIAVESDRLVLAGAACVITAVLLIIQKRTRFGLATTAVSESRVIAGSMGISPDAIAALTWALGSGVAAIAVILTAPISGLSVTNLTFLVIPALAAALVGRFESYPLALLGGFIIGIGQSEASRWITNPGWSQAAPLLVIIVVLIAQGRTLPDKSASFESLASVGPGKIGVAAGLAVAIGILIVLGISLSWISAVTISVLMALVLLSIVVVTGMTGQLSLAQLSLAGMGAFFTALFTIQLGFPMWLAVVVAALATVPVGVVVAIPALRTRGSNLAIASLGLATVITALVLNNDSLAVSLSTVMPPLRFLGINFNPITAPRSFAVLGVVVLALAGFAVSNLRRGASGRRLLAVRANERAAAAMGISVPGVKIFAFAFATLLAGIAGALLESQLSYADFTTFPVLDSINSVLASVLGGIGWVSGAVAGSAAVNGGLGSKVVSLVVAPGNWLYVLTGASVLIVLLQDANGFIPFFGKQLRGLLRMTPLASKVAVVGPKVSGPVTPTAASTMPSKGERRTPVHIEARELTVRFGGQIALNDVSFELHPGEILGLIGPNGAGKSTLIDVVSGFTRPNHGSVLVDGDPIDRMSPTRRARIGLSRSFQSLELFEDMTIYDNLRTASDGCPPSRYLRDLVWPQQPPLTAVAQAAIEEFHLGPLLNRRPSEVDYAHRRLAAIARAMASDPAVLFLDEPAAGLDETERGELSSLIRRLVDRWGTAVLLVEHDVDLVFSLCDRIVALEGGAVIAQGTPATVRESPQLIAAYLGAADPEPVPTRSGA